jgi:hypothetical protein
VDIMAGKRDKRLTREGEPSQKTPKGLEIPLPTEGDFSRLLDKAAKREDREKPSRSGSQKR